MTSTPRLVYTDSRNRDAAQLGARMVWGRGPRLSGLFSEASAPLQHGGFSDRGISGKAAKNSNAQRTIPQIPNAKNETNPGVAQLGARVVWDHQAAGSIPVTRTKILTESRVYSPLSVIFYAYLGVLPPLLKKSHFYDHINKCGPEISFSLFTAGQNLNYDVLFRF